MQHPVPCPFCGKDEVVMTVAGGLHVAMCKRCLAEGPSHPNLETAWKRWDNRFDGEYGITASELDSMVLDAMREWFAHRGMDCPEWLYHEATSGRPLHQTVTMVLSFLLDSDS